MKKILKLIKSIRNQYVDLKYLYKIFFYNKMIFNAIDLQVTGTGVLQLYYENHIVKISLGELSENNLEKEFLNYLKIKKSNLSKYIDYKLEKESNHYIIDKLENIEIDSMIINSIIYDFENEKTDEDDMFPNISFDLLNKLCNEKFDYKFDYKKSIMHGDLTPKNIMAFKGNIVLIDLDRFSLNGIKGIDEIHFIIEREVKQQRKDFFDWILENFYKFKDKEILFIYFVHRINEEHFEKIILPDLYYEKACEVYKLFIKEFS